MIIQTFCGDFSSHCGILANITGVCLGLRTSFSDGFTVKSAILVYGPAELRALNRHDVTPARPVRKSIFSLRKVSVDVGVGLYGSSGDLFALVRQPVLLLVCRSAASTRAL